jgi:hypothetical protein
LSDSYADGVSPSQHKLAVAKQLADQHVAPISTSGSDEEEEEVEKDVQQSIDGQSGTSFESTSTAAILSRLTKMSCKFAAMIGMRRKQQLVAKRKSALGHSIRLLWQNPAN